MLGLEYFDFQALWSPVFIGWMILISVLYLLAVGPLRMKFANSQRVAVGKKLWFLSAIALYYLVEGGPFNLLGHLMFSVHMFNMAIAYLVVPPMILLGLPGWLLLPFLELRIVKPVFRLLTNPIVALLTFNVLFSLYHMPDVMDFTMTHYSVHTLFHYILLFSAFMMWWPIVAPVPQLEYLSDPKKMAYIFMAGVLLTPACALITFAGHPLYAMFSDPNIWAKALGYCVSGNAAQFLSQFQGGPKFFEILPTLQDQQLGGVIMKLVQEFMDASILAFIFFRWYGREKIGNGGVDPLPQAGNPQEAVDFERLSFAGNSK